MNLLFSIVSWFQDLNHRYPNLQSPTFRSGAFWGATFCSILYIFSVAGGEQSWVWWLSSLVNTISYPIYLLFSGLLGVASVDASEDLVIVSSSNIAIVVIYYALLRLFLVDSRDVTQRHTWADSVYYLGFILTLVSLIVALTKIRDFSAADAIKGIIVQNAIALSSTVIALILRTAWKLSIIEPKNELEYVDLLTDAYKRLEQNVSATSDRFENAATRIETGSLSLERSILNLGTRMDQFDLDPNIVADAFVKAADLAFEQLSGRVASLDETFRVASEEIGSSVRQFVTNAGELDAKKVFEEQLEGAFSAIREATQQETAEFLSSIGGAVTEFADTLEEGGSDVASAISALQDNASSLDLSGVFADQLNAALEGFSEGLESHTGTVFEAVQAKVDDVILSLEQSNGRIIDAIQTFSDDLNNFDTKSFVGEATSNAVQVLNVELSNELNELREKLSELKSVYETVASAHEQSQQAFSATSSEFSSATSSARKLNDTIESLEEGLQRILVQAEANNEFFENTKGLQSEMQKLREVFSGLAGAAKSRTGLFSFFRR